MRIPTNSTASYTRFWAVVLTAVLALHSAPSVNGQPVVGFVVDNVDNIIEIAGLVSRHVGGANEIWQRSMVHVAGVELSTITGSARLGTLDLRFGIRGADDGYVLGINYSRAPGNRDAAALRFIGEVTAAAEEAGFAVSEPIRMTSGHYVVHLQLDLADESDLGALMGNLYRQVDSIGAAGSQ